MSPTLAAHLPYGTACGTARSFYETFASNTLDLAGRCFDEVVLHTFFTDETTARRADRAGAGQDEREVNEGFWQRHSRLSACRRDCVGEDYDSPGCGRE